MIRLAPGAFNTSATKRVLINGIPVMIVTNTKKNMSKDVKQVYGFGQKESYGAINSQLKHTVSIDTLMVAPGYAIDWPSLENFTIQLLDTNGPSYMCVNCDWTSVDETSQVNETTARNIAIEMGDVVEA